MEWERGTDNRIAATTFDRRSRIGPRTTAPRGARQHGLRGRVAVHSTIGFGRAHVARRAGFVEQVDWTAVRPGERRQNVQALAGSQADSSRAKNFTRRHEAAIGRCADSGEASTGRHQGRSTQRLRSAELDTSPDPAAIGEAEVYAMVDSLGDVGSALKEANPESLGRLYENLSIDLKYEPHARTVEATIAPRVVSVRVRGGT